MTSNCYEAGAFSYNLFMESGLGGILLIIVFVLSIMLGMGLMFKLLSFPMFKGIPRWLEYIMLGLSSCLIPFGLFSLFDRVGEVENIE